MSVSSDLTSWRKATEGLSSKDILPLGLGGSNRQIPTIAWLGDAAIKEAVCTIILEEDPAIEKGPATQRSSNAVSNANMAQSIFELLPFTASVVSEEQLVTMSHECGTTLEAAVGLVHQTGNAKAVREVAAYLLAASSARPASSSAAVGTAAAAGGFTKLPVERNPKSVLLELGGSVTSDWHGGPSHAPVFRGTAHFRGEEASSFGHSKKAAEAAAAAAALRAAFGQDYNATLAVPKTTIQAVALPAEDVGPNLVFYECSLEETERAMRLKDGEAPKEWFARHAALRKDAFRAALLAPGIFPRTVAGAKAWIATAAGGLGGTVCMIAIDFFDGVEGAGAGEGPALFVSPRPEGSKTQARISAGLQAAQHIMKLTGGACP